VPAAPHPVAARAAGARSDAKNNRVHVIDRDGKQLHGREAAHRGDLAEVLKRMGMFRR